MHTAYNREVYNQNNKELTYKYSKFATPAATNRQKHRYQNKIKQKTNIIYQKDESKRV